MQNIGQFTSELEAHLANWLFDGNILANRRSIVEKLKALHTGYSQTRSNFFNLISDNATACSYAVYYGIVNAAKVYHLLTLLPVDFKPTSLLDFGTGSGAASLSALSKFDSINNVSIVEHNEFMSSVASRCIQSLNHTASFKSYQIQEQIKDSNEQYDLIIAANSINEIPYNERLDLLLSLLKKISRCGYLIILEPGSRDITRQLMKLRESLVQIDNSESLNFEIIYPCTHKNSCSLLLQEDQWCHSEIILQRPETMRIFDQALGLNKHTVSFSGLILKKSDSHQVCSQDQNTYRVITEPKDSKVGSTSYICGSGYQGLVMLQKRDRNDENRYFNKLKMHSTCPWLNEFKKI